MQPYSNKVKSWFSFFAVWMIILSKSSFFAMITFTSYKDETELLAKEVINFYYHLKYTVVNLKLHSRDMTLFSLNEAEFFIFILNVSLLILLTFYNLLSLLVTLIFYFILERFMLRPFQIIITPSFLYELLQQSLLCQLAHLNLLIRLFFI